MIKRRKLIVVLNALYLSFIKKNTLIKSKEFPSTQKIVQNGKNKK